MDFQLHITDTAVAKMSSMCTNPEDRFRIFVQLSNEDGFTCGYTLDQEQNEDDILIHKSWREKSVRILMDSMSMQYLNGSSIDFMEVQDSFQITNPNAGHQS